MPKCFAQYNLQTGGGRQDALSNNPNAPNVGLWLKAAVLHIADSRLLLYGKQTFRIPEGDSKPAARCGNLICNFTNQMTDRFRLIRKEHL
jgi:hypothetical protein